MIFSDFSFFNNQVTLNFSNLSKEYFACLGLVPSLAWYLKSSIKMQFQVMNSKT